MIIFKITLVINILILIPSLSSEAFPTNPHSTLPNPPTPPTQGLYVNPARIRIGKKERERERETKGTRPN